MLMKTDPAARRRAEAHVMARVRLLSREEGGRIGAIQPGWGCVLLASADRDEAGWYATPVWDGGPIRAGDERLLAFRFLGGPAAAAAIRSAGRFFLWEERIIGDGEILDLA